MKAHYRAAIEWLKEAPLSGGTEGEKLRQQAIVALRHALNGEYQRWAEAHFAPTELVERHYGQPIADWQRVLYQRAALAVLSDSADAVSVVAGFREVARECMEERVVERVGEELEEEGLRIQPDPCLLPALREILDERTEELRIRALMDGHRRPHRLTIALIGKMLGLHRATLHAMLRTGNPKRAVMMGVAAALGWSLPRLEAEIEKKCSQSIDKTSAVC